MAIPYVPYEGPIVTRVEAKAAGLTRFFPGSKCRRNGHLSQRMTSNGGCHACLAIHSEAWQKANPEKMRRTKDWDDAHREQKKCREPKDENICTRKPSTDPEIGSISRKWRRYIAKPGLRQYTCVGRRLIPDPADCSGLSKGDQGERKSQRYHLELRRTPDKPTNTTYLSERIPKECRTGARRTQKVIGQSNCAIGANLATIR